MQKEINELHFQLIPLLLMYQPEEYTHVLNGGLVFARIMENKR
jgi:hypothetical protein